MTAATLLSLSLSPIARWFKRRWYVAQINHYHASADYERRKADESTRNASWYERQAVILKSELLRL